METGFKKESHQHHMGAEEANEHGIIKRGSLQLWQFLLQLLNTRGNETIIEWTRKSASEFKLLDPEEVARKWGVQKNRPTMNYDKLSRSLRYYYEKGIMQKVAGERYVYRFINHRDICLFSPEMIEFTSKSTILHSLNQTASGLVDKAAKKCTKVKLEDTSSKVCLKNSKVKTKFSTSQRFNPYGRQYDAFSNHTQSIYYPPGLENNHLINSSYFANVTNDSSLSEDIKLHSKSNQGASFTYNNLPCSTITTLDSPKSNERCNYNMTSTPNSYYNYQANQYRYEYSSEYDYLPNGPLNNSEYGYYQNGYSPYCHQAMVSANNFSPRGEPIVKINPKMPTTTTTQSIVVSTKTETPFYETNQFYTPIININQQTNCFLTADPAAAAAAYVSGPKQIFNHGPYLNFSYGSVQQSPKITNNHSYSSGFQSNFSVSSPVSMSPTNSLPSSASSTSSSSSSSSTSSSASSNSSSYSNAYNYNQETDYNQSSYY